MNGYLDVAVATNCNLTFPGSSRSDPWVSHSNPLLACGVAARVSLTQFGWRRVGWARPSRDGWSRGFHGRRAHCIQSDPVGGSRSRLDIRGCGRLVSRLCRHLWVLIRGELQRQSGNSSLCLNARHLKFARQWVPACPVQVVCLFLISSSLAATDQPQNAKDPRYLGLCSPGTWRDISIFRGVLHVLEERNLCSFRFINITILYPHRRSLWHILLQASSWNLWDYCRKKNVSSPNADLSNGQFPTV